MTWLLPTENSIRKNNVATALFSGILALGALAHLVSISDSLWLPPFKEAWATFRCYSPWLIQYQPPDVIVAPSYSHCTTGSSS